MCPIDFTEPQHSDLSETQKKQLARKFILDNSINDDQNEIIDRWAKTFFHNGPENEPNDQAVKLMMMGMAVIAQGDFEISLNGTKDKTGTWIRPSDALTIADYFSHGGRVMVDLENLSSDNKKTFLTLFPKGENDQNGRTSTHYTKRENGTLTEVKAKRHGLSEGSKGALHTLAVITGLNNNGLINGPRLTDFGLNIQMGGVNQTNLSGGVSKPGTDGHIFMHLGDPDSIMFGLEQREPALNVDTSIKYVREMTQAFYNRMSSSSPTNELLQSRPASPASENDPDNGLTGSHSLLGNSDSYTAAGSLYFSNLLYKLKLLNGKHILTPSKYNGMRVKLNDRNFIEVMAFYNRFLDAKTNPITLKDLLRTVPKNHQTIQDNPQLYNHDDNLKNLIKETTSEDLNALFKQIAELYDQEETQTIKQDCKDKLTQLQAWQEWLAATEKPNLQANNLLSLMELFKYSSPSATDSLKRALDKATAIEAKEALDKLNNWRPDSNFNGFSDISKAYFYNKTKNNTTNITTYGQTLEEIQAQYDAVLIDIKNHSTTTAPAILFGSLLQLEQIRKQINEFLSLERNQTLLDSLQHSKALNQKIKQLEAAMRKKDSLIIQLQGQADDFLAQVLNKDSKIEILQAVLETKNTLMSQPQTIRGSRSSTTDSLSTIPMSETHPIDVVPEPDAPQSTEWNYGFLMDCLSSSTAFNVYGTVLMIAALMITGAVSMGFVPLAWGGAAAALSLLAGSACFFKANDSVQDPVSTINCLP